MTEADWTPEEDEAFNEVEKSSNLGKQILRDMGQPYHYAPKYVAFMDTPHKREWVGLTDEEIYQIYGQVEQKVGDHWEAGGTTMMFPITLYQAIEAKLKEKNSE